MVQQGVHTMWCGIGGHMAWRVLMWSSKGVPTVQQMSDAAPTCNLQSPMLSRLQGGHLPLPS